MKPRFFSHLRSGLAVLGMLAGLALPAAAMPLAGVGRAAVSPAAAGPDLTQIHYRRHNCYDRWCGRYGRSQMRYRYWDDDWRYRRNYRHNYYRNYYNAYPGFYLGLGIPTYRYVQPRRYYRTYGGSSAHVAWCYDRWRSYRAWDNTYQPYHGPRRQCWSPYS